MRLALIGGGGSRVPLLYRGLLDARDRLPELELVLHDVDGEGLSRMGKVLAGIEEETGAALVRHATTDLDAALDGADFVVPAVRAGGFAARALDETIPLEHGVFGQETVGPGGLALAVRNIPVLTDIAARMRTRCPTAWMINLSNPAGMVTQAVAPLLDGRVVGVCDSPMALLRGVADVLGLPAAQLHPVYGGLNHLGFLTAVWHAGRDVLPDALAHADAERIEEVRLFGVEAVRRAGWLPNEYLYFYKRSEQARANVESASAARGVWLREQQEHLAHDLHAAPTPADALAVYREHLGNRHATYLAAEARLERAPFTDPFQASSGYHAVAVSVLEGLATERETVAMVNTVNRGAIGFLADDDVVEVPAVIRRAGVFPLAAPVPLEQRVLVSAVKAFERAALEAIAHGSARQARIALALHPLVPDAARAAAIVDEYIARIPGVARQLAVAG